MGILLIVVAILAATLVALSFRGRRHARAERALRESEERFRRTIDRAPVMLWTARADTTLDYLNHNCVEFTGLPIEKLLDEGWLDVVHPEDRDYCVGIYTPAIEARMPFFMEYRVRRADGAYRWLLASGVPKYGSDGSYAGYVGCDVDITERRNAEDVLRESQTALEVSHREIQQLAGSLLDVGDSGSRTRGLEIGGQPLPGSVQATADFDLKVDQWDAIVGMKGRFGFGADHNWVMPFCVDAGAGDSDLTWQAMLGFGYEFGWGDLGAAWRYLDYDLQSDGPIEELNFNGPALGATFRW